ncbi:hypothetical protein BLNAU_19599 [Blattamonas nauphoetae]|uniref:Uncharacterized protein n=1 Tax=Blattamonas nauphoetae TaxID=2049346 RepID=A0ABQ9X134_9EUKA|nr:hypothetical protein BLNAU_19599 [Blattamonas nauphoetae]
MADPHKSSFQKIILDDPSFPDLILISLKLSHKDIREYTLKVIINISFTFPRMKERFMRANLVGRMLEAVDFVSLPLTESGTHFKLTSFLFHMFTPIGDDEKVLFRQYPLIRVSVFDPAKQFITFIFHNSDRLILSEEDRTRLEHRLGWIHNHTKNMELRSDEHGADFVSELVKWEARTMVEMENEENFKRSFKTMLNRTIEWNQDKRERQKRREVCLREEGWDDAFELRVVGIDVDSDPTIQRWATKFRVEMTFNADRIW